MKIRILAIFSLSILAASLCLAQSSLAQQITNWGNEINGVQMSISVTNDTISVGSNIVVNTVVQNNSTNIIWLNPPTRTSFSLTTSSGKSFYLLPVRDFNRIKVVTANPKPVREVLKPGEIKNWVKTLNVRADILPDDYELVEVRSITIVTNEVFASNTFTLTSNSLKVKVVK